MIRNWIERLKQRRLERVAVETLHDFDDRRLRDIGTFRDSIELFVAEQAETAKQIGAKDGKAG